MLLFFVVQCPNHFKPAAQHDAVSAALDKPHVSKHCLPSRLQALRLQLLLKAIPKRTIDQDSRFFIKIITKSSSG